MKIWLSAIILGITITSKAQNGLAVLNKMLDRVKSLKAVSYDFKSVERIEGKYFKEENFFKIKTEPFAIYIKQKSPEKAEVLYKKNWNNGNALVNPNKFPYINLNLDPYGSLMRDNHHHTLHQAGFLYTASIFEHLINKYKEDVPKLLTFKEIEYNKADCYALSLENPHYRITEYTVLTGEDVLTIAKKLKISEYLIVEINADIDDYQDVEDGQIISITNDYCAKIEMIIDKQSFLPLSLKIYDHQGLFEHYEFSNIVAEPDFSDKDFSENNSEYGF